MALLPPLLLLLFAAGAGTFQGGATFAGATAGALALLALVAWGGVRGAVDLDPLRLGTAGRWLPAALLVAVVGSWWVSPVARAGRVGLVLLPAFLLLPAVVEHCWATEARRRVGLRGLATVAALVASWSLVGVVAQGSPRASQPLGHHNLLTVWLLAVLPLAVLPMREPGRWRWLGGGAAVLGLGALLAARSLLGILALSGLLLAAAVLLRRRRLLAALVLAALLAGGAFAGPRLSAVVTGRDPSALARATYWRAGWVGFRQRPISGWGPGSVPWTLSLHREPHPGVNPPGEVVGQLHSLPLQLAYELGAPGLLLVLATAGLFVERRRRELPRGARDPALGWAALAGLGTSGVALLGTAELTVTALPVALAVASGAALAAGPPREQRRTGGLPHPTVVYASLAAVALLPPGWAQLHYERSRSLEGAAAARELGAATALDPRFPLYRAGLSWIGGAGTLGRRAAAEPALRAAQDAVGLGPLWLMAGVYGLEAREPWAAEALERACRLDPLSPLAPFYLLTLDPADRGAPSLGARALLAEPRLLAATFWDGRQALLAAVLVEVERWPGVEAGWKVELRATASLLGAMPASGEKGRLVWGLDETGVDSLSLHAFRRRPRTARLAPVEVWRQRAEEVTLPPASALPGTSPRAFMGAGCRAPDLQEP